MKDQESKATKIRNAIGSEKYVDFPLKTSEKILARITDGIYRQPASALRELISNAYDADAKTVIITTDAPRFKEISIRDDGIGISPENLEYLIDNIGGSAKHTDAGKKLNITAPNSDLSPSGRKLIGKMGIGLFAVAQFTHHFLIITKCKGDENHTIADITLGELDNKEKSSSGNEIISGEARVWTEKASNTSAHGTEIKLLDLLPRTRAELCSLDRWSRIDFEKEEDGESKTEPPTFHIGRMNLKVPDELKSEPKVPWEYTDEPTEKFHKLVKAVLAQRDRERVNLNAICDNYLQMLWNLALACPLEYIQKHPFDHHNDENIRFFTLENKVRGQAKLLDLKGMQTPRNHLNLKTPRISNADEFTVLIDGIKITRPIIFTDQPKSESSIKTPLLFIGQCTEKFDKKPISMSRGTLRFEAYLFWAPKIYPKQHQGVMLRVGNAAGALFDRTFMDYQVSEQTRLRQIIVEIFVHEGLDGSINLDRESFNYAHPHYQYLVKWLHSAIRQFTNCHKKMGQEIRKQKNVSNNIANKQKIEEKVTQNLFDIGVDDVVEVKLIEPNLLETPDTLRKNGMVVFSKDDVFKNENKKSSQFKNGYEQKAIALTQLLHGWGLLEDLSYKKQAILIRDIMGIMMLGDSK